MAGKYRAFSVAEVQWVCRAFGYDWPRCPPECCGLEKSWSADARRLSGGYFRCAERHRELVRGKRANDPEWAERERELDREWKRDKYANDPEWAERQRERGLLANLTPLQRLKKRVRNTRNDGKRSLELVNARLAERGWLE